MFIVDSNQSSLVTEYAPHRFSAFASDLQFPVGGWPEMINLKVGNGRPLIRTSRNAGDEIKYVNYVQEFGCVLLRVYND